MNINEKAKEKVKMKKARLTGIKPSNRWRFANISSN